MSDGGAPAVGVVPHDTRAAIEEWFIGAGVPHFIADYAASRFVLTRAAPLLVLYLAVTISMSTSFAYSTELNALAVVASVLVVAGGWALVNRARGRPWRTLPRHVGALEVAAFLLLPALPPLLFGLQLSDALVVLLEGLAFLIVVYIATSYGLLSILRWAFIRMVGQLGSLGRLVTRALPLLMVFVAFLLFQDDTWQVANAMGRDGLLITVLLFGILSVGFLVGQLVPEVSRLARGGRSWDETLAIAATTPAGPLCDPVRGLGPRTAPLSWQEWTNVGAVVVFGQGVRILLVAILVGTALVVLAALLVPAPLQAEWAGGDVTTVLSFTLGERELTVTAELLTVAVILAAFSTLYFTVSALSDSAYREEFFSDADDELERLFAVRTVYRTALAVGDTTTPSGPPAPGPS